MNSALNMSHVVMKTLTISNNNVTMHASCRINQIAKRHNHSFWLIYDIRRSVFNNRNNKLLPPPPPSRFYRTPINICKSETQAFDRLFQEAPDLDTDKKKSFYMFDGVILLKLDRKYVTRFR